MVENELLLRQFYAKYVTKMTMEEMLEYQRFLDEVDTDMYKWLSNAAPFPEDYSQRLRQSLQNFVSHEFERAHTKQ